jgi:hypothetical protein
MVSRYSEIAIQKECVASADRLLPRVPVQQDRFWSRANLANYYIQQVYTLFKLKGLEV